MYFIVVSDNHGRQEVLRDIQNKHPKAKAFLHCGDSELSPDQIDSYVSVMGNNDVYHDYPANLVVDIDGTRVFMIHGHRLSGFNKMAQLVNMAKKNDCQIACFGHTHVFDHKVIDGINIINPGSVWHSRDGSRPCYAIVTVEDQQISVSKVEL